MIGSKSRRIIRSPYLRPQAFRQELSSVTDALREMWRQFLAAPTKAAYDVLVLHYLPLVTIIAVRLQRRRFQLLGSEDPDELIADGVLGLIGAILDEKYGPDG